MSSTGIDELLEGIFNPTDTEPAAAPAPTAPPDLEEEAVLEAIFGATDTGGAVNTTTDKHRGSPAGQQTLIGRNPKTGRQTVLPHPGRLRGSRQGGHRADLQQSRELSTGLRTALQALQTILTAVRPRFIEHWPSSHETAVLFADAFFLAGNNATRRATSLHRYGHNGKTDRRTAGDSYWSSAGGFTMTLAPSTRPSWTPWCRGKPSSTDWK